MFKPTKLPVQIGSGGKNLGSCRYDGVEHAAIGGSEAYVVSKETSNGTISLSDE